MHSAKLWSSQTPTTHLLSASHCVSQVSYDLLQIGAVLCKADADGNQITVEEPAFGHELVRGFYDEKGKGWWKKYGMVSMHDSLMDRLTNSEVCDPT